jgi:hypothetical protein
MNNTPIDRVPGMFMRKQTHSKYEELFPKILYVIFAHFAYHFKTQNVYAIAIRYLYYFVFLDRAMPVIRLFYHDIRLH